DWLKENILKDYLFRNRYEGNEFLQLIQSVCKHIRSERMQLCVLEIDHYERLRERFKDESGRLIRMTVLNIVQEIMNQYQAGEIVFDDENRYLLLFDFSDEEPSANTIHAIFTQLM